MIARIFLLLLAALFTFVVVTVAAFVYLKWWQALLASFGTFALLILGGVLLIRYAISRAGLLARGLFDVKSRVLRNATVDVHSVRRSEPAAGALAIPDDPDAAPEDREAALAEARNRDWYEIELTLFPDPNQCGPMHFWDVDDLRLVPAGAAVPNWAGGEEGDEGEEFGMDDLRVVAGGEAVTPDGSKFHGPHRLRFVTGVTRGVRELAVRYYFEQFGRITLPGGIR